MTHQLAVVPGLPSETPRGDPDDPSDDLFESKLHSPVRPGTRIRRSLLLERMAAADNPMVVAVFAAPGFGKTTFLTQWVESTDRPVAWVSLDESDNDPLALLTYVAAAISQLGRIDPLVFRALRSPDAAIQTKILPRLIHAVEDIQVPMTLVLDDVHLIHEQACLDVLSTLILRLPPQTQIALSGRTEPQLPLPRLRAQGVVMDIGARELSFGVDEAEALLAENDIHLRKSEVVNLVRHTEGWPVGIYLAVLAMRSGRRPNVAGLISGEDPYVADYLRTEFLDHQSEDTIDFLLRSAAVRDMCGPLCDAIRGSSDSAARLADLSRENMFVLPQDRQDKWYRYHPLFRELLLAEFKRRDPQGLQQAQSRAARWYEEEADPETALGYAQAAGDAEYAARLFNAVVVEAYRTGRLTPARQWLQWFLDRGLHETYPLVSLAGAWLFTMTGETEEAWKLASMPREALAGEVLADGVTSATAWAAQLDAAWCREGVDQMKVDAEQALLLTAEGSSQSAMALLLMGVANMLGDGDEPVEEYLADSVEVGARAGAPHALVIASAERAIGAIRDKDWAAAWKLVERGRETMFAQGLEEYPDSAILYATAAHVLVHHGETAAATEALVSTQRLRPQLNYSLPWLSVQVRLQSARAYMALADPAGARTVLREAEGVFRRRPDLGKLRDEFDELTDLVREAPTSVPGLSSITSAELRLLPLLGTHLTFPEIGERLFISRHTVKSQAISIYRKLGVTSRSEAVERASDLGLVEG